MTTKLCRCVIFETRVRERLATASHFETASCSEEGFGIPLRWRAGPVLPIESHLGTLECIWRSLCLSSAAAAPKLQYLRADVSSKFLLASSLRIQ